MAEDIRVALLSLRRTPAFTLVAVPTLALGIGAGVAMFSVLNGVLLRDLPVRAGAEVVVGWTYSPGRDTDRLPLPHADLTSFGGRSRAFAAVAGTAYQGAVEQVLHEAGVGITAPATWVTGNFFPLLGVVPVHGRTLVPADDAPGAEPVMVISHGLWRRYFGADPAVIGRALEWNGQLTTIVGVLPPGFDYPRRAEIWAPVLPAFPATLDAAAPPSEIMVFNLIGRLAPGVSAAAGAAELASFLRETDAVRAPALRGLQPVVTPLADVVIGDVRQTLWIAAAAVALLLLIACINVANLLLFRGSARTQEMAVRSALGAGRSRLVRQLMTESAVLAVLSGAAGTLLAAAAVRALVALAPPELPRLDTVNVDTTVLLFALGASATAALLAGLLPALLIAVAAPGAWLRGARGAVSQRSGQQLRQGLVIGQTALAILVVSSAGLLVRSLYALQHVDMGFNRERLLIADASMPAGELERGRTQLLELQEAIVARISALPEVSSAAALPGGPFAGERGWIAMYSGDGQTAEQQTTNPWISFEVVGPGYFETLEIPIRSGRGFTTWDRDDAQRVAVVSEAVARHTWPGSDPIGRRIKLGPLDGRNEWHTVVGVVGETRYRELAEPHPTLYLPVRQFAGPVPMSVAVRTRGEPAAVLPQIRTVLHDVHPRLVLAGGGSMRQLMAEPLARPRFAALLLTVFAAVTLLLAVVGIYGVLAFTVRQRTREIGVRLALGARAGQVRTLVIGQGLRLAVIGCVIGTVAALAAARTMRGMLYGVEPGDPLTFGAVAALILLAAALACYLPARRASRVDPAVTLRTD
jgi:putative ABC transport system permease protein